MNGASRSQITCVLRSVQSITRFHINATCFPLCLSSAVTSRVDYDTLNKLPYPDAVCRETLHLHAPAITGHGAYQILYSGLKCLITRWDSLEIVTRKGGKGAVYPAISPGDQRSAHRLIEREKRDSLISWL